MGFLKGNTVEMLEKDFINLTAMANKNNTESISMDIFVKKEQSDFIRRLFLETPIGLDDAIFYAENSTNYERDYEILEKLSNKGYDKEQLRVIIVLLNK